MVTVSPEQLKEDAICFFRESELPESFEWVAALSPLHLRLFTVELADGLKECMITGDFDAFVSLIEGWEATAALDASPEVLSKLGREKTYRPLSEFTA